MNEFEYKYYKHVSPNGILVVTNDGELIEVNCPFRVKAKTNFPKIKSGTDIWVQKVQVTGENKDVFIINDSAYMVQYFQIILSTP